MYLFLSRQSKLKDSNDSHHGWGHVQKEYQIRPAVPSHRPAWKKRKQKKITEVLVELIKSNF
jgi:hypothetical protein